MRLTNWGRFAHVETTMETPRTVAGAAEALGQAKSVIARGLGRCYGDSSLNDTAVVSSLRLDKMISFDEASGELVAEAGVSLADILAAFAPRGWFLPVTPGTKFVTLGGAVASDVHGKNHHVAGSMARHVRWFEMLTATQGLVRCSPSENAELFHATCGGHGLTGVIVRVALGLVRTPSVWLRQQSVKAENLDQIMDAFERYAGWTFSVAWIDCLQAGAGLGRSILMCGEFATPDHLPAKLRANPHLPPAGRSLAVPLDLPGFVLNPWSVRAFNAAYFAKAPKGVADALVSYDGFFYPLDAVLQWNRIYGKRGFTQYQFVIPKDAARQGLSTILARIAQSGQGSFLAVLKLFGPQPVFPGNISFPMEGYTLALDFPISPKLFPLLRELDRMVLDFGGRHYLTKDARLSAEAFRRGYGQALDEFLALKKTWDPDNIFSSLQSRRLGLA